jgi:putative ABC transport system permease protein
LKPVLPWLAYRNLVGNARRTGLTVSAIAAGLGALVFLWAFNDGLHRNMLDNFQDTLVGSLQIHRQGFFDSPRLERHIPDAAPVLAALEQAGVARWTWRLETYALAASQSATEGSFLIGLDPRRERRVTRLHEKVSLGRFLAADDVYTCVLGATAARNLGVEPGDSLVLVAYDRFGVMSAERFELVGIIASGEMGIDRGLVLVPLASLQEMLEMEGRVTDFPARVAAADLDRTAQRLRMALAGQDLEVMRWHDMFPVMHEWVTLHNGFLYLFLGIVLFIVMVGVLNTLLLSVLDRVREMGVLKALGNRNRELARMLLTESLLIGVTGVLLGLALGLALVAITGYLGIDMSAMVGGATERFYVDPVIHPVLQLEHLGTVVAAVFGVTLLAGLYPAWRAARLTPAQALRYV